MQWMNHCMPNFLLADVVEVAIRERPVKKGAAAWLPINDADRRRSISLDDVPAHQVEAAQRSLEYDDLKCDPFYRLLDDVSFHKIAGARIKVMQRDLFASNAIYRGLWCIRLSAWQF